MKPPLVVIVGETASGKSALALRLAEHFGGEIISADSWTVYKDFDIGTAKPSPDEQARVPHHLIDVADPRDGFSAAVFQRLAAETIGDIAARNKLPILVGGARLYVDGILYEYEFLPPPAPERRAELNAMDLEELLQLCAEQGLDTTLIDTRNKRRIIRLIENEGRQPGRQELRENTLVLGIATPRNELQARIQQRVDTMLAARLEDEVRRLKDVYGWDVEPMKGIGYREWKWYFAGEENLEAVRQRIVQNTLQLAKKQRTWFRRNKSIQWLGNRDAFEQSVELIATFLARSDS